MADKEARKRAIDNAARLVRSGVVSRAIPSHRLDFTRGTVTPRCCDGGWQDRGCENCPTRPELDDLARSLRPSPEARRETDPRPSLEAEAAG